MSRFYLTTPIYYVNDLPHLGTAYTTIVADTLARYHRLRGHDTRFLTGTDEHGQKIERAAQEKGVSNLEWAEEASRKFRDAWPHLNCEPDDFIRTTERRHVEVVQDLWRKCVRNGAIYEGTYEGLYCVGCEAFYTEKELEQTPAGLVCPIHRVVAERVREPSFFFRLSHFEKPLLAFYDANPGAISPESRRNEVLSFVKSGLQDLSISRTSFAWGIPVPEDTLGDSATRGKHKHVMYVWFDALTNYLSALGPEGSPLRGYWPADVHLVGKDILRFHAVYWPAFLLGAGFSQAELPRKVFAHGWLTINGQKMSKSLRNTVEPLKLASVFGADVVRYYLLREVAFGQDGDFSHAQLIARYNAELADSLGNLLNRTLGLCTKLRGTGAPGVAGTAGTTIEASASGPLERKLEEAARTAVAGAIAAFDEIAPHRAIDAIWMFCRAGNKYVDEAAPWAEAKKGESARARVDTILASALEALRWIATMIWPVMPEVSGKILAQLGLEPLRASSGAEGPDALRLEWRPHWDASRLSTGTPIFPKIDAERQAAIFAELGVDAAALAAPPAAAPSRDAGAPKSGAPKKEREIAAAAAEVTYDEFARLDLRIGTVVSGERVPKSDKLLKLQVDLGEGAPRQVVAGIGKSFTPEAIVGQQVVVVANLKPVKLMGLESRGMILAASEEGDGGDRGDGDLALLTPTRPRTIGRRVK